MNLVHVSYPQPYLPKRVPVVVVVTTHEAPEGVCPSVVSHAHHILHLKRSKVACRAPTAKPLDTVIYSLGLLLVVVSCATIGSVGWDHKVNKTPRQVRNISTFLSSLLPR